MKQSARFLNITSGGRQLSFHFGLEIETADTPIADFFFFLLIKAEGLRKEFRERRNKDKLSSFRKWEEKKFGNHVNILRAARYNCPTLKLLFANAPNEYKYIYRDICIRIPEETVKKN